MSIISMLEDAKNGLAEIKRKYKFKKANEMRKDAAELQSALAKCRGQLEICQKEFKRTILTQSRNYAEGRKQGADTRNVEAIIWDAAIGYLLVKDAIYAVKTINSNDSIAHAYDMLDAAADQMRGKRNRYLDLPHMKPLKRRNNYGYVASDEAVREKENFLNGFFEKLKVTGDIDACIEETNAANASGRGAEDGYGSFEDRLNAMEDADTSLDDLDLDDLKDIHGRNV